MSGAEIGARISMARGLVNGPRTRARFDQLFELVVAAHELEEGERALLVSYVRGGLASWPAQARRLPPRFVSRILQEGVSCCGEALSLCESVDLGEPAFSGQTRSAFRQQDVSCDRFLLEPALSGVREFVMERYFTFSEALRRRGLFSQASFASCLERLTVSTILDSRWLSLPSLRAFSFIAPSGHGASLERWVEFIHGEGGGLRSLSITRALNGASMLGCLVGSPCWEGVERLGLRGDRLGDEIFSKVLWGEKVFKGLELGVNRFSQSGVLKGLSGMEVSGLEQLGISSARFDASGVSALAKLGFESLSELDLSFNVLGVEGVEALGAGAWAKTLRALDVSSCGLWECERWEALGSLGQLVSLSMRDNELGAGGAARLAGCGVLRGMSRLDLARNNLDVVALLRLLDALGGPTLRALNVGANGLSQAEIERLSAHPHLRELEELRAIDVSIDEEGRSRLRDRLPGCALELSEG